MADPKPDDGPVKPPAPGQTGVASKPAFVTLDPATAGKDEDAPEDDEAQPSPVPPTEVKAPLATPGDTTPLAGDSEAAEGDPASQDGAAVVQPLGVIGGGTSDIPLTLLGAGEIGADALDELDTDLDLTDALSFAGDSQVQAPPAAETEAAAEEDISEALAGTSDMVGRMLARTFGVDMVAPEPDTDSFSFAGLTTEQSPADAEKPLDPFLDSINPAWTPDSDIAAFMDPATAIEGGFLDAPLGEDDAPAPLGSDDDLAPIMGVAPDGWVV